MMSRLRVAALALAFAGGCAPAGPPAPPRAETLVLGETSEPISLNPLLLEGTTAGMIGTLLYSFLVTVDARGNLVPDAAAVVPTVANGGISRDGLTVTYHLRRGARWQDGRPLTAHDCVFTFRAIMDPKVLAPDRHGYDQIANVTAPDAQTVVVHLKRPYAPLVATFLEVNANYPIVPAHLLEGLPDLNHLDPARYTVGSGPYRLVRWRRGEELVLEANPTYFRGKPRIARVVLRFVPDATTIVNQLHTHELDAALSIVDPALLAPLRALARTAVVSTPAWGVAIVYFNTQTGPTSDRAVRVALSRAIDAELVIRRATQGAYGAAHAWRGLFGTYDANPALPPFDPRAAGAALDALGWTAGGDGIRRRNGRRLTLTLIFSTAQPLYRIIATEIQAELREVGVDTAIRGYSANLFKAPSGNGGPMFGGKFDLVLSDIYTTGDADTFSFFICSERAPAGFNIARMCDPRFDALFDRTIRAADPAATRRSVATLETMLAGDAPAIVLGQLRFISAFDERLHGVAPNPVTPFGEAWNWSLAAR
jgi:peptide/nickel transport system substrate-binding protein